MVSDWIKYGNGKRKPVIIKEKDYKLDIKKEYILTWSIPNIKSHYNGESTPRGTIVIDVEILFINKRKHGFNYTVKETGEVCHTMYGSSLAEYTPENMKIIEEYWSQSKKIKELEEESLKTRDLIKTLEPKNWTEMPEVISSIE